MKINEIAELAGVSPATVSNVLNGRKNVGEETRNRVLEICRENGYHQKRKKRFERYDNKTILFNFSDYDRKFYLKIIHGISDYVYSRGYDLIICTSKSCPKFMDFSVTSGTVMLDMKCTDSMLIQKASEGYPIVTLDRIIEAPNIKSVVVNNYTPMCELVQGLVDRGYRKFSFLGGIDTLDNQERYQAFRDVLEKNRIRFKRENYLMGDYSEKSGYQSARLMLLSENIPEVLVCANDNMAIGAMNALKQEGLRIPEDIAVTGFDGTDMAPFMKLTTVDIPNYERGYLAAQFLLQLISGKTNSEMFKIAAKVHWRESVGVRNKEEDRSGKSTVRGENFHR
ncbi:MAG TPA: LacI family transcriptional regulator [Candidatus Mediterraneibacter surreyensis]|nr:LacI family transcriptional regulator [Candidatus Mediterraneibacter surreyensis]